MPALPDVPNVVKIVLSGTLDGEPWAGITHWRYVTSSGTLSNANANAIASDVGNRWGAYVAGHTTSNCILELVEVTDLTSSTSAVGSAAPSLPGSLAAPTVSPSIAVLEHKTVARRYRGGHPRTYWPGVSINDTAGQNGRSLSSTALATWATDNDDYYAGVVSFVTGDSATNCSSFHEVCVHYRLGGVALTFPSVDDIVARSIETNLANQRRRMQRSA